MSRLIISNFPWMEISKSGLCLFGLRCIIKKIIAIILCFCNLEAAKKKPPSKKLKFDENNSVSDSGMKKKHVNGNRYCTYY